MPTERDFSPEALEMICAMARRGANINSIRGSVHGAVKIWYKDFELIEAAARFGHELRPIRIEAYRATSAPIELIPKDKRTEKVGRVAPGTFPVPVGGYRILGRR